MIEKLVDYVNEQREIPFKWGASDCCVFVNGAIEIMTGERPIEAFTVEYADEKTGRALLDRHGGLARILTDLYGRSKSTGEIGDLAYSVFPDGSAVGLHMGQEAVFKGEEGLVTVPLENCKFFKVK